LKKRNDSVLAVIPVWNSGEDLRQCLGSLADLDYGDIRFIVADNNSSEDIEGIVKDFIGEFEKNHKRLEYLRLDDNYGPTGAMNRALKEKYSGEDYILRVDSDIIVREKDVLKKLVSFMKSRPDAGIAGPKMFAPEINLNIVATYRVKMLGTIKNVDKDVPSEADMVNAGFMLVKGELYRQLGNMWSEILFYSWEEIDISERAKELGYLTYYYPGSCVIHNLTTMALGFKSQRRIYYEFRNMLLINWKYGSALGRLMNFGVLFIPRIAYWLIFRTGFKGSAIIRAIKDFFSLRTKFVNEFKTFKR
jgi:GT2 family glycosyltransferase